MQFRLLRRIQLLLALLRSRREHDQCRLAEELRTRFARGSRVVQPLRRSVSMWERQNVQGSLSSDHSEMRGRRARSSREGKAVVLPSDTADRYGLQPHVYSQLCLVHGARSLALAVRLGVSEPGNEK